MHFADVWRLSLLIPEVAASPEAQDLSAGVRGLAQVEAAHNVPFDRLVNELLATPIAVEQQSPESVLKNPEQPNPLAFFAVKDASPANLAATTTRMFLGIQIECTSATITPSRWSREQFWNQAAFFAGVEQGEGIFAPLSEMIDRREIKIGDTKKVAAALFLDEKEPVWKTKASPRVALAEWITAADNPYFARATVNRLWGKLFGQGIVKP